MKSSIDEIEEALIKAFTEAQTLNMRTLPQGGITVRTVPEEHLEGFDSMQVLEIVMNLSTLLNRPVKPAIIKPVDGVYPDIHTLAQRLQSA